MMQRVTLNRKSHTNILPRSKIHNVDDLINSFIEFVVSSSRACAPCAYPSQSSIAKAFAGVGNGVDEADRLCTSSTVHVTPFVVHTAFHTRSTILSTRVA